MKQMTLDELLAPAHVVRGGGPMHEWTCPACVLAASERRDYDISRNPHRFGTKAHQRWARDAAMSRLAIDPRTETYWCL